MVSIQVLYSVALFSGFVKGMLLAVKQGIKRIQIPESMIKVHPSKSCKDEWAAVVFKKLSAPSQDNKYLGRHLDPNEEPPLSFKEKKHKELSDMYQRILIGLALAPQLCTKYVRQSRKTEGLMHTHLMGVPFGEVFIPGCETLF
jgi:hypothetical protein